MGLLVQRGLRMPYKNVGFPFTMMQVALVISLRSVNGTEECKSRGPSSPSVCHRVVPSLWDRVNVEALQWCNVVQ
jgi:hypothetical protein